MRSHAEIASELDSHGIDHRSPGFYDHAAFVAQERRDPQFLERYAQFVATVPSSAEYEARVRREVPLIASLVHQELVSDGRLGACIDIGMILSRILEREQIWNFQVKGSLTIDFQDVADLPPQYFWSVDISAAGFAAAHSWLVVPPFSIVDVALKQQPYRRGRGYVPSLVITDGRDEAPRCVERIVSPDIRARVLRERGRIPRDDVLARELAPAWLRVREWLPATVVKQDGVSLVYDAVAIGAPDAVFEEMNQWLVNGRTGFELYNDVVAPSLLAARGGPAA